MFLTPIPALLYAGAKIVLFAHSLEMKELLQERKRQRVFRSAFESDVLAREALFFFPSIGPLGAERNLKFIQIASRSPKVANLRRQMSLY